jgi:hypothetical protein
MPIRRQESRHGVSPQPDFFIAGALKCGTTSLFSYLRAHPAVFMPANKEPNYFCGDLVAQWPDGAPFRVGTLAEY